MFARHLRRLAALGGVLAAMAGAATPVAAWAGGAPVAVTGPCVLGVVGSPSGCQVQPNPAPVQIVQPQLSSVQPLVGQDVTLSFDVAGSAACGCTSVPISLGQLNGLQVVGVQGGQWVNNVIVVPVEQVTQVVTVTLDVLQEQVSQLDITCPQLSQVSPVILPLHPIGIARPLI